ncbi:MAG TPA: L-2-hydroxyglutarate oxidase [Candidatus Binatia bacterium]|nr:L-2-hydroxyglutarate oxidase [Candidatus Binatia bacterium]
MASQYDLTIVGGGILGLATALKITAAHPRVRLLLLEKEAALARHQTGNNSGVIHSGLYYRPGSLKARTCVTGRKELMRFCDDNSVPYEICGKVVVATSREELPRLDELQRRGEANGLRGLEVIAAERLKELEPHATGIKGLFVPETGIIDYKKVADAYADRIRDAGGDIRLSQRVVGILERPDEIVLQTSGGDYRTKYLINCCGLQSDLIAKMTSGANQDGEPEHRIIPFRGEYYTLAPERQFLVKNLIYPVPDPTFPFLGVHFTRMAKGGVEAGPNAVLAYAREGYRHTHINMKDLWETVSFKGFWAMTGKYWQTGFGELYRSLSKTAFVRALQKLLPEIRESDLVPGGAGVRAQAVSASGALVDDFVIKQGRNMIHILNAPSPGATASLAIGQQICAMAEKNFTLNS